MIAITTPSGQPLDRVSTANRAALTQSFTYDASGNRVNEGGANPSWYTMWGTSNRLAAISGAVNRSYTYDAAGNTLSDGARSFTYDDLGRMASATNGATTTYVINALGQRVKKSNAIETRLFVYDEAGHLLGEYDATGNLIQETVWLDDIPVATLKPNGAGVSVFYIHTDHLNTPRRIARSSDNAIIWRWDTDPFGAAAANEDPDGDATAFSYSLRFPGQYFDVETGLHYNYYRSYDPITGRYVESDPIGLNGGINTYAYVGSDPLLNIDPFGLELYIPESTADCWVNFLYDNRNNPIKTGRWVERETAPYTESLFAIPVVLPSVPLDPTDRRTRLEPASVGAVVVYAQYRDTWRHQMLERRVSYEYICQDPCTGEIDEEFGQASDEIVGPREQFVRKRLIGVDYEFMPSQLPISPPSPRRIPQ